jgi:LysR family transcriptional regulator, nitrogen assimilation regulatory protein
VAQPALGLQIRNLEDELGVALLHRHSRGVEATPAGKLLYVRALEILEAFEQARQEVMGFGDRNRETIRFGITPSIMQLLGPDILLEARELMPNIFLSLVEELSFALIAALETGDLDAALTYQAPVRPNFSQQVLAEEDLLLVSSPELDASTEPIPFREVAARDLVLAGERDVVRTLIEATARRLSTSINVVYESQSIAATRNLVARAMVSTITPYGSIAGELTAGTLKGRRIYAPTITRTLYLVRRAGATPNNHETEFKAFLQHLLATMAERLGDLQHPLGKI